MANYYIAPSDAIPAGSDSNLGTIESPWFSLNRAWSGATTGDTIYMRGGSYIYYEPQIIRFIDASLNPITIRAFTGEIPIITRGLPFDYGNQEGPYGSGTGIGINAIYLQNAGGIYFDGIKITGYNQVDEDDHEFWSGTLGFNINNCEFRNMEYYDNAQGLRITHHSSNNYVINSDFHHNYDPYSTSPYGNGDGLYIGAMELVDEGTSFGDTFQNNRYNINYVGGVRCYTNCDDGFDMLKNDGIVVIDNSWFFNNGFDELGNRIPTTGDGNGVKLGTSFDDGSTTKRFVTRCISAKNREGGFRQNNAECKMEIYNNTTFQNGVTGYGGRGYDFWNNSANHIVRNNIAFQDISISLFTTYADVDYNTFNYDGSVRIATSNDDFISVEYEQLLLPRKDDGSLPDISFLHLAPNSNLINAGVSVNLPYRGIAPDLGVFESGRRKLIVI